MLRIKDRHLPDFIFLFGVFEKENCLVHKDISE